MYCSGRKHDLVERIEEVIAQRGGKGPSSGGGGAVSASSSPPPPAAAAASSSSSAAAAPSSGALPEVVSDQRLTKADALAIANAIHCPSRPTYVDFKRETRTLKVYTGSNGCRRCDVVVDQVSTLA